MAGGDGEGPALRAAAGDAGAAGEAAAAASAIVLDQAACELLEPEVSALLESVRGGEARARFLALQAALDAGRVDAGHLEALEQVLRLGIETGRFERVYGRAADTLGRGLYARTPSGRAAAAQAAAVSSALGALAGSHLGGLTVAADGPGGYRLTLETDRGAVVVRIDRAGIAVSSVEVGE